MKNLPAWLTSLLPFEKKKLAPRRPCSKYLRATVRAIVDFPVPAKPFSQKMHRLSCPSAQSYISRRTSTRVSGRQGGSCCLLYELKGASAANGKHLSGLASSIASQRPVLCDVWRKPTETVCVSQLGFSASVDVYVLVVMPRLHCLFAAWRLEIGPSASTYSNMDMNGKESR